MIGQSFSHYEIVERIGAGGMGEVYRARDLKLGRFVALKFLPRDLGENQEQKRRFIREARAASAIEHPNICAIHAIEETADGRLFIAMPCYEGETIDRKIARGPLPVEEIVELGLQAASGLAAAHERGIVHRDIKPANLMVTRDGTLKILDFGLSKIMTGASDPHRTDIVLGSAAYISPEQVQGEEANPQSDIWALGVVLYEMATGVRPFHGANKMALLYAIVHRELKPPIEVAPNIPHELDAVIRKALVKDRPNRYHTIEQLSADLKCFAEQSQTVSLPVSALRPWIFRRPRWSDGRRPSFLMAWLAVAVLGVLLVGILGWKFLPWNVGEPSSDAPPRQATSEIDGRSGLALLGFWNRDGVTKGDWLATALCDLLHFELPESAALRWMNVGENAGCPDGSFLFEEYDLGRGFEPSQGLAAEVLAQVQRESDAALAIVGFYRIAEESPDRIELDLLVQDAHSGRIVKPLQEAGPRAELAGLMARLADPLGEALGLDRRSRPYERNPQLPVGPVDPEAARFLTMAREKLRLLDAQAAHDLLQRAIELEPGNPLLYTTLAETFWYLGRQQEARQQTEIAFRFSEGLPREVQIFCQAQRLAAQEQWTSAAALLRVRWIADEHRRPLAEDPLTRLDQGIQLSLMLAQAKQRQAVLEMLAALGRQYAEDPRIPLIEAESALHESLSEAQKEAAQRAAAMADRLDAPFLLARAHYLTGEALRQLGAFHEAEAELQAALAIYVRTGHPGGQADTWNTLGSLRFDQRDLTAASTCFEAAARLSAAIGYHRLQIRVLTNKALLFSEQRDLRAATEVYQQALWLLREHGDRIGQVITLVNYALSLTALGDFNAAGDAYKEAFDVLETLEDPESEAFALIAFSELLILRGELVAAGQRLDKALGILQETGNVTDRGASLYYLAWVRHYQGDLVAAQSYWEEASKIFEESDNPPFYAMIRRGLGETLMAQGKLADARICFDQALAIEDALAYPHAAADTRLSLAALLLAENKPMAAESLAREALADLAQSHAMLASSRAHSVLASSLLDQDRVEAAQGEVELARDLLEGVESPVYRLPLGLTAARILIARGQAGRARENLEQLLVTVATSGFAGWELEIRLLLGEIELRTGSARAGRNRLRSVSEEADLRGFLLIAEKARHVGLSRPAAVNRE